MIIRHIEMACCRLPERADTEIHAVFLPSLFVDLQHGNAGGGARQACLEAAHCLFTAKAMRDRNDQRSGHPELLFFPNASSSIFLEKKSEALSLLNTGTFRVPRCFPGGRATGADHRPEEK